jgi:hypothetical protein
MTDITITAGGFEFRAELNDSATARAVAKALPIMARGSRWGEEIYFEISVKRELEKGARDVLEAGELGYWPTGRAFCIFFGPTPASQGDEIRAASPVNVIGRIKGELTKLLDVPDAAEVEIRAS